MDLRLRGHSYSEIRAELGVSMSSLSLWLRDIPLTPVYRKALAERHARAVRKRADAIREASRNRTRDVIERAASEVGRVTGRDLFIAGVIAYWAEGSKSKPWGPRSQVAFINSDPDMIRLFLAWLNEIGIGPDGCSFRLSIHESADIDEATRRWAKVVGVSTSEFLRPTLKRHNPATVRKNKGDSYSGCLVVKVRRSVELNARIEGWFQGIVSGLSDGR